MLTNSYVTLLRFDEASGEYTLIGCYSAWVHRQRRTRSEKGGTYSRDVFDVRIPHSVDGGILTDDLIYFGKVESALPAPAECSRIAAVTENRTGHCPHWHLEAENQYR